MVNGKVYAVGGWSGQTGLADCEVYDPQMKLWSPIASMRYGKHSKFS